MPLSLCSVLTTHRVDTDDGWWWRTNPSSASHNSSWIFNQFDLDPIHSPPPPFQAMSGEGEDNYSRFVFICVIILWWMERMARLSVGGGVGFGGASMSAAALAPSCRCSNWQWRAGLTTYCPWSHGGCFHEYECLSFHREIISTGHDL